MGLDMESEAGKMRVVPDWAMIAMLPFEFLILLTP